MSTILTKKQAKKEGYTHHALLYGLLPCWYKDNGEDEGQIAWKFYGLGFLDWVLTPIWMVVWGFMSNEPPQFGIKLRGEI